MLSAWVLIFCFFWASFVGFILAFAQAGVHLLWALSCLIIAVLLARYFYINVPASPPHVAILKKFGERIPEIVSEGWHLISKPFFGMVLIKVEKVNLEFTFSNIRTIDRPVRDGAIKSKQAGGEIEVQISLTYNPDYKHPEAAERLLAFLNSGSHNGVKRILEDLIEEDVRQLGGEYDWESYSFGAEDLTQRLVKKLTGEEIVDPESRKNFMENGLPDVIDLGISISRLTIGRIKELGELAKAAERKAVEEQERAGEETEIEFVRSKIKDLMADGLTAQEAIDLIQVERGKISVSVFRGLENNPLGGLVLTRPQQDQVSEKPNKRNKESRLEDKDKNKSQGKGGKDREKEEEEKEEEKRPFDWLKDI